MGVLLVAMNFLDRYYLRQEREGEPKKLHVMKQTQCNNFPWKNNIFSADTDVCSCYCYRYHCCYIRCCLLYSSFMDHDKNDYSSNRTKRICRILVTSMTAGLSASQPASLPACHKIKIVLYTTLAIFPQSRKEGSKIPPSTSEERTNEPTNNS